MRKQLVIAAVLVMIASFGFSIDAAAGCRDGRHAKHRMVRHHNTTYGYGPSYRTVAGGNSAYEQGYRDGMKRKFKKSSMHRYHAHHNRVRNGYRSDGRQMSRF